MSQVLRHRVTSNRHGIFWRFKASKPPLDHQVDKPAEQAGKRVAESENPWPSAGGVAADFDSNDWEPFDIEDAS